MADLGYPVSFGSLGAVTGIGAAVLTTGTDARKIFQIGGLALVGVGGGMALDPESGDVETIAGGVLFAVGLLGALFGGNPR